MGERSGREQGEYMNGIIVVRFHDDCAEEVMSPSLSLDKSSNDNGNDWTDNKHPDPQEGCTKTKTGNARYLSQALRIRYVGRPGIVSIR